MVANFADDFPVNGEPLEGWTHQWNAPGESGISNDIASTELVLTNLIRNDAGEYTVDGDSSGNFSGPDGAFLKLSSITQDGKTLVNGHPGGAGRGSLNRFAVASYRVEQSGVYSIDDSVLNLLNSSSDDGVSFRVFVNRNGALESSIVARGSNGYFESELGFLAAGDSIHVAFGAEGNRLAEAFEFQSDQRLEFNDGVTDGWIRQRTVSVWFQSDDPESSRRQVIYTRKEALREG